MQSDQRLGHADGTADAIQTGNRNIVTHLAREARDRTTTEDDDLGLILFDGQHALLDQTIAQLFLRTRDIRDRHIERADTCQPAGQSVLLRAFDVPGAQAWRQTYDRIAPTEHPGSEDSGFLDAYHRHVGE